MLELDSPDWANLSQAYGDATEVPAMFAKLRAAASPAEWEEAEQELMNAALHQGTVYTAAYAIAAHLLQYATELGPGKQSDALLFDIAYASRSDSGEDVPDELEEDWEDTQDNARELILERLLESQTSEALTACLIAGLLYLSGEWSVGKMVNDWCWGHGMVARCKACKTKTEVCWHEGAAKRFTPKYTFEDIKVQLAADEPVPIDEDFEFDEKELRQQIISLAAAAGHHAVERQLRSLFGSVSCAKCGTNLPLTPKEE